MVAAASSRAVKGGVEPPHSTTESELRLNSKKS
jgi:hypothetical protein